MLCTIFSYLHLSHAIVILIRLEAVAWPDEISSVGSVVEVARVLFEGGWLFSSTAEPPDWPVIAEPVESRSLSIEKCWARSKDQTQPELWF